jgi:hypothetical protein
MDFEPSSGKRGSVFGMAISGVRNLLAVSNNKIIIHLL